MTTPSPGNSRPARHPPPAPGSASHRLQAWKAALAAMPVLARRVTRFPAAGVLRSVTMVLAPIVLLTFIAVGVVYVRLSHGPVSLKVFAASIERGINAELDELTASIGDLQATLGEHGGIEFRLIDVHIDDAEGSRVASAPYAAVTLSRTALWGLRFIPERVYLIEPSLGLYYSREAGLSLSFAEMGRPSDQPSAAGPPASVAAPGQRLGPLRNAPLQGHFTAPSDVNAATPLRRIDLARVLATTSARARRGEDATSYLREIGLRDATVSVDYDGKVTHWQVPEVSIDLEHMKRRSVISGLARVASDRGPWALTFRTEDSDRTKNVSVKASIRDLVPSSLGQALPELKLFEVLDLPVAGDASVELSTTGVLKSASFAVELGHGHVRLPSLQGTPLIVDAALFHLGYDAESRRLSLSSSTIKWGNSFVTLSGQMNGTPDAEGEVEWAFDVAASEGALAAEEFGVEGAKIEEFSARGRLLPHLGQIQVADVKLKAAGTALSASGEMTTTDQTPSLRLDVQASPMPVATLKALWPRAVAAEVRDWVGKSVTRGNLGAATLKMARGRYVEGDGIGSNTAPERVSLAFDMSDLQVIAPGGTPIEAPRVLVRLENDTVELAIPDAAAVTASDKRVPLKNIRVLTAGGAAPDAMADVSFRAQSALPPVLEILARETGQSGATQQLPLEALDGKVDAQFSAKIPLKGPRDMTAVKLAGKARITDLRSKQKIGPLELQSGAIDVEAHEAAVEAKGELLLNGVPAQINWQHIFDVPADQQPPMRLTATLDNADRNQLGLDINHLVQGELPVEITFTKDEAGHGRVQLRGDLTNADVGIYDLAWRKPRGRPAQVQFDVAKGRTDNIELQNFKIAGESVAIEGWLSIDNENEVREFYFPDFSLNVVSRLEVQGTLGSNRIWSIKAKGATFDGKDFFKKLVSSGHSDEDRIKPRRPSAGMDIEATIDTVLGHNDASLRGFQLKMSERADKLVALDARGTLDGSAPLTAQLKPEQGKPRMVNADSSDGGQALRLVGFYKNMQGGKLELDVNLDGKGAADKTGTLWVKDFRVLGDPVVSEVISNTSSSSPESGPTGQRKVVREVIEFTGLRAPFSAGHGQFVIEESYIRGPMLGATIRGKIDHVTQRVNLGGTYIPAQGINSALCQIPIFGPIITGPKCEGLLGITYAIQGPMSQPQVIVNPFSMVAPGIFREIFQMTSPDPKVLPRGDETPALPIEERARTSSSSVSGGITPKDKDRAGEIDGWSSSTSAQPN